MKLKWKSVRIFVLLAAMILGMSGIFIYLNIPRSTSSEAVFYPTQPMPGQESSLDQAQASVSFKIGLPPKMGNFVQLRLDKEGGFVWIIYATDKPSDSNTVEDVIGQNGVMLFEASMPETLQIEDNNFRASVMGVPDLQLVTVNGYLGVAGGNIEHCVSWCTEKIYYRLTASVNYPLPQLVAMAQSIPVN
jgi:hypothetical protein